MNLEDLQVYQKAMELADEIWKLTQDWEGEATEIRNQTRQSFDAWAVHLSLGYGQYQSAEKLKHIHECKGQVLVAKTLLQKALSRGFLPHETFEYYQEEIEQYLVRLNNYIKSIHRRGNNAPTRSHRSESYSPKVEEDSALESTFAYRNHEEDGYNTNLDTY
jgi:four helix bundle protein